MNETQIRNEPTETRDDANADPQKWADAIQNLLRIIERSEQKLGYFENRVKQAKFMDRPNQQKVRAAGAQVGAYSAQLEGLRNELYQLERLHSGGIHFRQTKENELRRIWGWINRPTIRKYLYTARVSFETFLNDWHQWMAQEQTHALAVELQTTRLLIGFVLLHHEESTVTIKFVVIRPDYRARGYGTDTLVESVRYAFEQLGAEHITLQVSVDNGPALICFENAGFRYLGYTETSTQAYTMGIERNEWEGDEPIDIDEESASPRLSVPLRAFFDE
jgi:RimJ/RimL family protein N-acetyltransferase